MTKKSENSKGAKAQKGNFSLQVVSCNLWEILGLPVSLKSFKLGGNLWVVSLKQKLPCDFEASATLI